MAIKRIYGFVITKDQLCNIFRKQFLKCRKDLPLSDYDHEEDWWNDCLEELIDSYIQPKLDFIIEEDSSSSSSFLENDESSNIDVMLYCYPCCSDLRFEQFIIGVEQVGKLENDIMNGKQKLDFSKLENEYRGHKELMRLKSKSRILKELECEMNYILDECTCVSS